MLDSFFLYTKNAAGTGICKDIKINYKNKRRWIKVRLENNVCIIGSINFAFHDNFIILKRLFNLYNFHLWTITKCAWSKFFFETGQIGNFVLMGIHLVYVNLYCYVIYTDTRHYIWFSLICIPGRSRKKKQIIHKWN